VREQVEPLEDHADLATLRGDGLPRQMVKPAGALLVAQQLAVDPDAAAVDSLQLVDAAQERRLTGAGGSQQADHLALADIEVDALEDLDPMKGLGDVDSVDERHTGVGVRGGSGHHAPPIPAPRANLLSLGFF